MKKLFTMILVFGVISITAASIVSLLIVEGGKDKNDDDDEKNIVIAIDITGIKVTNRYPQWIL